MDTTYPNHFERCARGVSVMNARPSILGLRELRESCGKPPSSLGWDHVCATKLGAGSRKRRALPFRVARKHIRRVSSPSPTWPTQALSDPWSHCMQTRMNRGKYKVSYNVEIIVHVRNWIDSECCSAYAKYVDKMQTSHHSNSGPTSLHNRSPLSSMDRAPSR